MQISLRAAGRRLRTLVLSVLFPLMVPVLASLTPALPAAEGSAAQPRDAWVWPLHPQPAVLAGFDPPPHPYGPGHRGVDLAGQVGQQVLAVAAGEVSFAGSVAGREVVVVDHGRLRTTYEPVVPTVGRGDRVGASEVLGTLTALGSHCLPASCLHLGVREGDAYLDPLRFLEVGPIRLLPVP